MNYTLLAGLGVLVAVLLDSVGLRTKLLRRRAFWTAYAIILVAQLVVNGLLTGLRIVRYDPHRIIGWRFGYAPVEDLLFGFAMVTCTLSIWVWLGRRLIPGGDGPAARRTGRAHPPRPDAAARPRPVD